MCGCHTGFICRGSLPLMGAAREKTDFDIKLPFVAPILIFPRGHLLIYFAQGDTSLKQWVFEIIVFPLLGELPKAIESCLPIWQLLHWQLGSIKWSPPMTKSFDPIVVTVLRVGFQGKPQARHRWIFLQLFGDRGIRSNLYILTVT